MTGLLPLGCEPPAAGSQARKLSFSICCFFYSNHFLFMFYALVHELCTLLFCKALLTLISKRCHVTKVIIIINYHNYLEKKMLNTVFDIWCGLFFLKSPMMHFQGHAITHASERIRHRRNTCYYVSAFLLQLCSQQLSCPRQPDIFGKYFSQFSAVCLCTTFWGRSYLGFLTRRLLSFSVMTSLRERRDKASIFSPVR